MTTAETAWVPLPTHSGWWWKMDEEYPSGEPRPVYVEIRDGRWMFGHPERDGVFYTPVAPPPPADAAKLPRRFRWKGYPAVMWPSGAVVTDGFNECRREHSEQWLSDHADEIEWIDP